MTKAGGFTELECWKDARELVVLVYKHSNRLLEGRETLWRTSSAVHQSQ